MRLLAKIASERRPVGEGSRGVGAMHRDRVVHAANHDRARVTKDRSIACLVKGYTLHRFPFPSVGVNRV